MRMMRFHLASWTPIRLSVLILPAPVSHPRAKVAGKPAANAWAATPRYFPAPFANPASRTASTAASIESRSRCMPAARKPASTSAPVCSPSSSRRTKKMPAFCLSTWRGSGYSPGSRKPTSPNGGVTTRWIYGSAPRGMRA